MLDPSALDLGCCDLAATIDHTYTELICLQVAFDWGHCARPERIPWHGQ
jgi:hypothetical protein